MKGIFAVIPLSLLLFSCSNKFLELYPETSANEGIYYNNENDFILLVNGCYVPMKNYEKIIHWSIAELTSDNASFQNPPIYNLRTSLDLFSVLAGNSYYSDFWDYSYQGITRCNKTLFEINSHDESIWNNLELKNRSKGETLFLRALYYFNLARQYGDIPLVLEPIVNNETNNISRTNVTEVYKSIIADLNESATFFSNARNSEENGRANYAAALSLLGKVYLTNKEYSKAESVLKKVIDLNSYHLLLNYGDLFNPSAKDYTETIFAVQYSEESTELSNSFAFYFAPWTSKGEITGRPNISTRDLGGWNQPTDDLLRSFELGDKRKEVSIGFWNGQDWDGLTKEIPYCKKFKGPTTATDNKCGDNFPVIRYSDVLLMYAEVLNEQNKTNEAIPYVYQVRHRAGLTTPLEGFNKSTLEDLIAKERQVEFCFENQRWYDLKRTGKALEVLTAHGEKEKSLKPYLVSHATIPFDLQPYKLLAPIPPEQIALNKNLIQNPGY